MITYTYIVRCPECEDEFFDFFDEAKDFAMGCLTKKPIITQTEVNRNDFGECTDHCDLGTVWSWEDLMKETGTEPATSVFNKDDLKLIADGKDPEFDAIDNSVDFEIPEVSEREPISENAIQDGGFRTDGYRTALACYDSDDFDINVEFGMQDEEEYEVEDQLYLLQPGQTVADLVVYLSRECGFTSIYVYGETSANRNEIRTATRFTTVPGAHDYRHYGTIEDRLVEECAEKDRKPIPEGMTIEELVEEMEENEDTVECTWCNDLFDKSECRKEVDLGWLCSRCEMAIKSRGETLTFREGNYWDFLDEDAELHDLGNEYDGGYPATQTWVCYFDGVDIGTVEAATEDEALEKMQQEYPEYPYGLRKHDDCYWVELENVKEDLTEASLTDIMAGVNHEYGTNYTERDILDAEGIDDGEFFNDLETQNEITAEAQRRQRQRRAYAISKAKAKREANKI